MADQINISEQLKLPGDVKTFHGEVEGRFVVEEERLLEQSDIIDTFPEDLIDGSCFLCAEPTADYCHRRLVVESLKSKWMDMEIVHL